MMQFWISQLHQIFQVYEGMSANSYVTHSILIIATGNESSNFNVECDNFITISSNTDEEGCELHTSDFQSTSYSGGLEHADVIRVSSGSEESENDSQKLFPASDNQTSSDSTISDGLQDKGLLNFTSGQHIPEYNVDELPYDIDGNVIYRLPYDVKKKMKSSLDGRPWKTWVTSLRKGLAGVRRRATCKGSFKCYNIHCSYQKQYNDANRTQFEKEEGETVCKCCGVRAVHIDCLATKVWEFPRNSHLVTVIHSGNHTCIAVPRQTSSKLETTFTNDPDLRPGHAACKSAVNAMKAGKSWEEIEEITDTFINKIKVKNVKQKIRKSMHPSGANFEAVGELKSKVDEKDPFYIYYRINDRKLNHQKSYVFKTSRTQAKIALSMD